MSSRRDFLKGSLALGVVVGAEVCAVKKENAGIRPTSPETTSN